MQMKPKSQQTHELMAICRMAAVALVFVVFPSRNAFILAYTRTHTRTYKVCEY